VVSLSPTYPGPATERSRCQHDEHQSDAAGAQFGRVDSDPPDPSRHALQNGGKHVKDRITVERRDGAFGAYVVGPRELPAPAVVVLHEVFGVNADIRKTCDELTENGFVAVAPDCSGVRSRRRSHCYERVDWQHGLRLYQA
jgi:Dienelactone hydrolase family